MNRREAIEVLAARADQRGSPNVSQQALTRHDQVQALLDLAEQLQGILVPVEPDPRFRRRLHGELVLEAQRRQMGFAPGLFQQHRKGIIIGAAAVGSVASVVGVAVAYVLRRHSKETRVAAS